ncbi:MAG: TonB-dependent receptor, partial [Pseudomonadota bacterium]
LLLKTLLPKTALFNATRRHSPNKYWYTFASCSLLLHTAHSIAQPVPIEEIIVTADFRQATINDIPASISVLDSALIQSKNALHLEDLLLNAPNVNVSSGASRARFYQIRGIGERGQFTEPLNSSVGLIIDGVDFSGIGNAAMLYDVEQVEVLMGPQGTRYGSNALAGLINLQSRAPTSDLQYGLQLQGENYDSTGFAGYVSGPASNTLSYRLALQTLKSDGFGKNLTLDRPTNTRDEQTLRGKIRWTPASDITVDLTTALVDIDNGYDAFSLDNIRDTLSDQPGVDQQDSRLGSLKLSVSTFDNFSLEALANLARSDTAYGYDEDWTYTGFHPDEYSSTDLFEREHDTRSGELRLLSTDAGALFDGRTSWVTGIYSLQQEVALVRTYTFLPENFTSSFDVERLALYADTHTLLNDKWSLDAGLRSERYEASYDDSDALNFDPNDTLYGGKLALNYRTEADNLIYASVSRGYKTGGFNTDGSLDADLREFDTEVLWNYELGFKGNLWDGRLQTQAAVFLMDRDDVQISSSTVRLRADGSSEFIDYTGNAAAGTNRGVELNARLLATDALQFYTTVGLLDTEYQDFINSEGQDLDGREQAHAPRYQYTFGSTWEILPELALDLNVQGRDGFYYSDSHYAKSNSYALLNASLTWTHAQWQTILWGRNLNDRDYYVRGYYFGNDPRDGYTSKDYTQLGEPLRYGLTVKMDF